MNHTEEAWKLLKLKIKQAETLDPAVVQAFCQLTQLLRQPQADQVEEF